MRRIEIFLYVVAGNKSPDRIEGVVPFRVDDSHIFHGPDQTQFRKEMRDRFLTYSHSVAPEVEIYLAGVNELVDQSPRKILWFGRITRVMTFEAAHKLLETPEFSSLENVELEGHAGKNMSPLHLEPIILVGHLGGYRHRSDYHSKTSRDGMPDWVKDVVDPGDKREFGITEKELLLKDLSRRKGVFKRDCCFLLENIFFAQGKGFPITDELVSMLRERQPGQDIDNVALFGHKLGKDGKKTIEKFSGKQLHIRWQIADRMLEYLLNNLPGR